MPDQTPFDWGDSYGSVDLPHHEPESDDAFRARVLTAIAEERLKVRIAFGADLDAIGARHGVRRAS